MPYYNKVGKILSRFAKSPEKFGKQDVVARSAGSHNCAQLRKKERKKCAQTLDKRRSNRV